MTQVPAYGAVVAANVRAERNRQAVTQANCARRMRALGFDWHPQTVGAVERDERRLTVEELLGLCVVLEATLEQLALPSGDASRPVLLPSGAPVIVPTRSNPDFVIWEGDKPPRTASQALHEAVHASDQES